MPCPVEMGAAPPRRPGHHDSAEPALDLGWLRDPVLATSILRDYVRNEDRFDDHAAEGLLATLPLSTALRS
jgi:hypothetical protein